MQMLFSALFFGLLSTLTQIYFGFEVMSKEFFLVGLPWYICGGLFSVVRF